MREETIHPLSLIYACSLDLGEFGFATGEVSKLKRKIMQNIQYSNSNNR